MLRLSVEPSTARNPMNLTNYRVEDAPPGQTRTLSPDDIMPVWACLPIP
jgi:hypothetical protein